MLPAFEGTVKSTRNDPRTHFISQPTTASSLLALLAASILNNSVMSQQPSEKHRVTLSQEGGSDPVETVATLARPVPPPPPRWRTRSHHSLSLTRRAVHAGRPLRSHRAQGGRDDTPGAGTRKRRYSSFFPFLVAVPVVNDDGHGVVRLRRTWTLRESLRGRLRRGASTDTLARTVTSGPSASRLSAREGRTRIERSRGRAPARRVPSVPSRERASCPPLPPPRDLPRRSSGSALPRDRPAEITRAFSTRAFRRVAARCRRGAFRRSLGGHAGSLRNGRGVVRARRGGGTGREERIGRYREALEGNYDPRRLRMNLFNGHRGCRTTVALD